MIKTTSTAHEPANLPTSDRSHRAELEAEADRLYEKYVKPLEAEHWGE